MFDTREKKERALGTKLFLKAERCASPKCAVVRRPYFPGVHGKKRRRAPSETGVQLREKQKIRFSYGISESQLKKIFTKALRSPGVTGKLMISFLERRLDNVVFRLGLTSSRAIARQLVSHGHILVNGRRITVPSYQVKIGDLISIRPQSQNIAVFRDLEITFKKYEPPSWLKLDKNKREGKITALPSSDIDAPFDTDLVVDYYVKRM